MCHKRTDKQTADLIFCHCRGRDNIFVDILLVLNFSFKARFVCRWDSNQGERVSAGRVSITGDTDSCCWNRGRYGYGTVSLHD